MDQLLAILILLGSVQIVHTVGANNSISSSTENLDRFSTIKAKEPVQITDADSKDVGNLTNPSGTDTSNTLVISASAAAIAVVVVVLGLGLLVARKKRLMRARDMNIQAMLERGKEPSLPYVSMGAKVPNRPKTNNDNYTNLVEQESSSLSTLGSSRNISMLPVSQEISISVLSEPVGPSSINSRRSRIDEIDKRASCPEWKLLENETGIVSRAISQDSGFVGSRDIPNGSRLTVASSTNMSLSNDSDLSRKSLEYLDCVDTKRTKTAKQLQTKSLKPGLYEPPTRAASLGRLQIPFSYAEEEPYFSDQNLLSVVEPFLKNPSRFRNKNGTKRTYATMSFAIGAFDSSGGVLSLPNRSVELIIPPHAVERETVIYFSVVNNNTNNSKEISLTPEIDLGPDGTQFNCPVALSFQHCSDVNENSSLKYAPMVQEGDSAWRELSYDESMCTVVAGRVCLFIDHFSRVKIVLQEGTEPDAVSIDENAEIEEKTETAADDTQQSISLTGSSDGSTVCSHNGACACPRTYTENERKERGARPKTLPLGNNNSSSATSLASTDCKKKKGALVKVKRIIQNKLRPIGGMLGKPNGASMNLNLCVFVERCEQMIKLRVYYAVTPGIIDDIAIKEHGDQSTTPCCFTFRRGQGSLKVKLDTSNLEMYWSAQSATETLSEEHILSNKYDHVEFTIKPTTTSVGLLHVYQSKRPHDKRKLNPTWGHLEAKAIKAKHWMQSIDTDNTDIIAHMLVTRGVEPIAMVPRRPAIPYRLLMELCKILDPDERARANLADSIGIDYVESKWIQSRKCSGTKVILTFLQALFHKESSDELLRRLFVHLKEIKHDQAADVVLEYLRGTSRLRGQSSSSQSSSENDVNNSTSNSNRSSNNLNPSSYTSSLSSINTSSSTIANMGDGSYRSRNLSETDSGYSPSPSSPPVVISEVEPGVHVPKSYTLAPNRLSQRGIHMGVPLKF